MPDTQGGREEQAADEDRRQRELDMARAFAAATESDESVSESTTVDWPPECHRRDCHELAAFRVIERYQEETGHGAVEAEALLCPTHTREESPANLDRVYEDYVFRVEPLPERST